MPHNPSQISTDAPGKSFLAYQLVWPGKALRGSGRAAPLAFPRTDACEGTAGVAPGTETRNRLYWGDNLQVMESLLPELRGKIDLVYMDPPFDAGHDFRMQVPLGDGSGMGADRDSVVETVAYRDTWGEGADSYLQMLYDRMPLVRELLSETGSLIIHVNWRVAHLLQVLLDELFGPGERRGAGKAGFRNEIIWGYGGGGSLKNAYRRKHDNLYWYTRSDRWTFNPQYRPYSEKTQHRGLTAVKGPDYTLREEGASLETWWTGPEVQKILSPTARENLKFPTQKPEALLERIVRGHSRPDDLVADFFCGSGTLGAVAERLGRRWIMADAGSAAVHLTRKRLAAVQAELAGREAPFRAFDVYRTAPQPAAATPAPGRAVLVPLLHRDGTADIRLAEFHVVPPAGEKSAAEHLKRTGTDFIDYWAIDWDYGSLRGADGQPVFRHRWWCGRLPGQRRLRFTSDARHRYPTPGLHSAAVKIVDVWGGETLALAGVGVPVVHAP